jgi:hypothetical protein
VQTLRRFRNVLLASLWVYTYSMIVFLFKMLRRIEDA